MYGFCLARLVRLRKGRARQEGPRLLCEEDSRALSGIPWTFALGPVLT